MALAWNAGWVNSPRGFKSRILRQVVRSADGNADGNVDGNNVGWSASHRLGSPA